MGSEATMHTVKLLSSTFPRTWHQQYTREGVTYVVNGNTLIGILPDDSGLASPTLTTLLYGKNPIEASVNLDTEMLDLCIKGHMLVRAIGVYLKPGQALESSDINPRTQSKFVGVFHAYPVA